MRARRIAAAALVATLSAGCSSGSQPGHGSSTTPSSSPSSPSRVTKVDIPFQPIGVAAAGNIAWVASALSDKVYPVDLATMRAGTPVSVGKVPLRVAVAKDGVWVSIFERGGISRVDAPTTILPIGRQAEGIVATSDDALWVVDQEGGQVVRVAPGSPRRVAGRARVGVEPRLVASDGGTGVVVTNFTSGTVTAVDATMHTRSSKPVCSGPQGVAVRGGRIAVACTGSSELVFLDRATLRVTHRITGLDQADALTYASDGTLLLGLQLGPTLIAIGPDDKILARIKLADLPGVQGANVAVAALPDGGALLTSPDLGELFRVPKNLLHP